MSCWHFRFCYVKCLLVGLLGIFHRGYGLQRHKEEKNKKKELKSNITGSSIFSNTVWKSKNFSVIQILREINLGDIAPIGLFKLWLKLIGEKAVFIDFT